MILFASQHLFPNYVVVPSLLPSETSAELAHAYHEVLVSDSTQRIRMFPDKAV